MRLMIALVGMTVFTLVPAAYQYSVRNQEPADFATLVAQLDGVELCPEQWEMREAIYEFGDEWQERLGLHHSSYGRLNDAGR